MCLFLWSYFLKNSLFYRTVRIWNTENPRKNKTVIKTKNKQGEKVLRLLDYDEDYDEVFGKVCRASQFSCISPQSSAQRLPFFFHRFLLTRREGLLAVYGLTVPAICLCSREYRLFSLKCTFCCNICFYAGKKTIPTHCCFSKDGRIIAAACQVSCDYHIYVE